MLPGTTTNKNAYPIKVNPMISQRELVLEAIEKGKFATEKAVNLKSSADPEVRELATAVHHLAYALQQIGLALTDEGRDKDLSF